MQYDILHTDKDLIMRIAKGDEQAFTLFYRHNWRPIYQYLISVIKSAEVCEELVADIFVKIWQSRDTLNDIRNLDAYFRQMVRNKAIDYLRAMSRNKKLEQEYRRNIMLRRLDLTQLPGQEAETNRLKEALLSQLSPQRKKVFIMHRDEGLSYSQIAEKLQISVTTVKKTMSEALSFLHKAVHIHQDKIVMVIYFFVSLKK